MKTTTVELSKVVPEFQNPKNHDIGAIIVSIRRFGFVAPLIVNSATGRLLAGHGRTEALRAMWNEGEDPPVNIVQTKEGEWKVPTIEVEIADESEALAYLVADNRLTELGGWDESILIDVMKDLAQCGEDLFQATGWDEDDLSAALKNLEGGEPPKKKEPDPLAGPRLCPYCGEEIDL